MFQPGNEDAKFVYKLEFEAVIAPKLEWDSAVFKAGPFVDTELEAYRRLAHLQGQLIPKFYGQASFRIRNETLHGILIEFAEGQQLYKYSSKMGGLTKKPKREIRKLIFLFRRALNESGVKHGDPHRSNMLVYLPNTSAHHISIWITQSSKYLRRKSLMVTTMRSPIGSPA